MAKILFIMPQMPYPPHQGTSLRNYHILKGLRANHEIDLLTFEPDTGATSIPDQLADLNRVTVVPPPERSSSDRLLHLVTQPLPDMAQRLKSVDLEESLRELLTEAVQSNKAYEIVQIEGIELAYTIPLIRAISPGCRIVFDDHNAEAELQMRAFQTDRNNPRRWPAALYSYIQAKRLQTYEAWTCNAVDWVTVVSTQDLDHLSRLSSQKNITVVPNCIDVVKSADLTETELPEFDLVFTGKMDYRPNIDAVLWFANNCWPLILRDNPETTWAIVGQKPHRRLNTIKKNRGIKVTGWVESVLPYISQAKIFIMPFRIGSGTRLKLIEAMAAGKAVVSTHVGAEGFNVEHNNQLLLADSHSDFALQVLRLLGDQDLRNRLGKTAQKFSQQYDWRRVIPRFEEIYQRLLQ